MPSTSCPSISASRYTGSRIVYIGKSSSAIASSSAGVTTMEQFSLMPRSVSTSFITVALQKNRTKAALTATTVKTGATTNATTLATTARMPPTF